MRGPQATSWMLFCPVSSNFEIENDIFRCCMKYRLGVAINFEGPDCHGHFQLASSEGGRSHARHTSLINAWRQIFVEAGGQVPNRNIERLLRNTHVPCDPNTLKRLDLVVPGLTFRRDI